MSATMRRMRRSAFGFLILLLIAGVLATAGRERSARAQVRDQTPSPKLTRFITSEKSCSDCHGGQKNYDKASVICQMNEAITWSSRDKHKLAYRVLLDGLGSRMAERLGLGTDRNDPRWRACLGCHSVVPEETWNPDVADPQVKTIISERFDKAAEGVSCVACHGAYLEWVTEHQKYEFPTWRNMPRPQKDRDYGMVDLWDPVIRLKKCSSCHIGNASEGKVLTHAMYAAGHPPLPGLEVATFSLAMPKHWEYLREKLDRIGDKKPAVRKTLEDHYDLTRLEQTELVLVSGLVPLRATLALLIAEAEQADRGGKVDPVMTWPDYARFDCYACHHDVTVKSWRQSRAFADDPGRPPAPGWPNALIELGLEAAEPARAGARLADYRMALRQFRQDIGARPFGNREQIVSEGSSARKLIAWIDSTLLELRKVPIDPALAQRILEGICRKASDPRDLPDFDTARQLYWAFKIIDSEIHSPSQSSPPNPAIRETLAELDNHYHFSIPVADTLVPIEPTLADRKDAVARFDPARFQKQFAEIQKLLNQNAP
jgi:hypothetical protein